MSFFKKKQDANADIDKALKQEKKPEAGHMTRSQSKALNKKKFDIEAQKGAILDELKKAYTQINTTSHYEQAERVMQIMTNLKTGAVDSNARAVYALDGLILKYVQQLNLYCKQNNLYGIMSAIDSLDTFVNQRAFVTFKYFEDPNYLAARVKLMEFEVNRENLTTEINKKIDNFNTLKASAAGESEAKRMQIQKQMSQIKSEKDTLQKSFDHVEAQIKNLTTLVAQMEQNATVYLPEEIVDEFGNVLEQTKETDIQISQVTKMAEKIEGANKTVHEQGMNVTDADNVTSTSTADLESMEI